MHACYSAETHDSYNCVIIQIGSPGRMPAESSEGSFTPDKIISLESLHDRFCFKILQI